jgi:hypothetical protein
VSFSDRICSHVVRTRVEVYQADDAIGITRSEVSDLISADGMPGEDGALNVERIENSVDVSGQSGLIVWSVRMRRLSESAARDRNDAVILRKALGEIVEDVRVVAYSAQKHERHSAPAKVEHMEPDSRSDVNAEGTVRRRVSPSVIRNIAWRQWGDVTKSCFRDSRRR